MKVDSHTLFNGADACPDVSKKYYILRLDSYSGDDSSLICEAGNINHMYVVLVVTPHDAAVVDMGYSSVEQLVGAWRNVTFQNRELFHD